MQVFTKGCIWQISTDGNLSAGVSESVYSNATVDYSIYFIVNPSYSESAGTGNH